MVATVRMDISNVQTSIYRMAQMLTTQQQAIAMLSQQLVAIHQGLVQSMVEIATTVRAMAVESREVPENYAATTPPATPLLGPMTPERHQERVRARSMETSAEETRMYEMPRTSQEDDGHWLATGQPLPRDQADGHALLSPEIPIQVGDTSPTQTQTQSEDV